MKQRPSLTNNPSNNRRNKLILGGIIVAMGLFLFGILGVVIAASVVAIGLGAARAIEMRR